MKTFIRLIAILALLPGTIFDLAFPWMFMAECEYCQVPNNPIIIIGGIVMALPVALLYFLLFLFVGGHIVFGIESIYRFILTGEWRFDLYR